MFCMIWGLGGLFQISFVFAFAGSPRGFTYVESVLHLFLGWRFPHHMGYMNSDPLYMYRTGPGLIFLRGELSLTYRSQASFLIPSLS